MSRKGFDRYMLVADIGGTHARFALTLDDGRGVPRLEHVNTLPIADHDSLESAIGTYLQQADIGPEHKPRKACLAIAAPIGDDQICMTNGHWQFSRSALGPTMGLDQLLLINDFAAQAYATLHLQPEQLFAIGGGGARQGYPVAVVGPGTGLGVGGLTFHHGQARALSGEGGHVDFAPYDELEQEILRYLWRRYDHLSAERLLSGMGLRNLYQALSVVRGAEPTPVTPEEITAKAMTTRDEDRDELCIETLNLFCAILGGVAGNIALTLGAQGGVYITGGIVPRILPLFEGSRFRERFEAKGRYRQYMEAIPTRVVLEQQVGLIGAAAALMQE